MHSRMFKAQLKVLQIAWWIGSIGWPVTREDKALLPATQPPIPTEARDVAYCQFLASQTYSGPKVSRRFNFPHSNFNLFTAISIYSRQFQFYSRQFQFVHGNFSLLTAISIIFAYGQFNLLTTISTCSRQFQFALGNFNLLTAISIF